MTGILGGLIGSYGGEFGDFELIERITLANSTTASVSFSSIPSAYKHLQVRGFVRGATNNGEGIANISLLINNVSSNVYAFHSMTGQSGPAPTGLAQQNVASIVAGQMVSGSNNLNYFSPIVIDFSEANSTSKRKAILAASGNMHSTNRLVSFRTGAFLRTEAINTLTFLTGTAFASDTKISLYGIRG